MSLVRSGRVARVLSALCVLLSFAPAAVAQTSRPSPEAGAAASAAQPGASPTGAAASAIEAPPSVALPPELARVLSDYESRWAAKDAKGLAALFAEDGWVLAFGAPPVRGRAAIEKHYSGSGGPLSLRAIDFAAEGNIGYILGGFAPEPGKPDVGKFTLTLRKGADGRWLILSDMDNPNARRGPG
jgi:ketosteroid isomerase-like protein